MLKNSDRKVSIKACICTNVWNTMSGFLPVIHLHLSFITVQRWNNVYEWESIFRTTHH